MTELGAPPEGLGARARRAWETALLAVDDPERYREAVEEYAHAIHRVDVLRAAWRKTGEPATTHGGATGAAIVPHPLVAMIGAAEKQAHELGTSLGLTPDGLRKVKPRAGRPREIVPALPSAQRVRRVK